MKTVLDENDFVIIENVPIFTAHQGEEFTIDADKLSEIAKINNERVSIGETPTLCVGHNEDDNSEKPAVGFFDNFTTGLRNGMACLFARFLVYKDKINNIRDYPKRSIEIFTDSLIIPCCALVGSRQPATNIGLLYFTEDKKTMKFTLEENLNTYTKEENKMVPEELKAQILEVLAETDVFAFIHSLMEEKAKETKEEIVEETVSSEEEVKETDEEGEQKEEFTDEAAKESDEKAEDAIEEEVANEEKVEEKAEDESEDEEKKKKFTAEAELAELKLKFTRVEREKKLILLNNEGYDFDVSSELEDVADMTDAQFDKHLVRIARFTKKAPVNLKKFNVQSVNIGGSMIGKEPNPEDVKAFALKNKCDFIKAYQTLKAKI